MAKKVNLSALEIRGIDGKQQQVNIQDEVANLIYMQGQSIADCELGRKIYNAGRDSGGVLMEGADRTVNLSTESVEIVKRVAHQFPYVIREAMLTPIDAAEDC